MITEISADVFRLESVFGGRPLYQYVLAGEQCVLVDTGVAGTPHEVVLPALKRLGIGGERLAYVIVTHSDYDHQGGNHAIKAAFPRAVLCCGRLDRPLVADPDVLFRERYDAYRELHDIGYDDATRQFIFRHAGAAQPLDLTLTGGEMLRIGAGWDVELLHVPGHSRGHLSLYDHRSRALYTGDAVHWSYYPGAEDGRPALPPTYLAIDSYLATIRALGLLQSSMLAGAHWPLQRGDEVAAFLAESRRFVETAEAAIIAELEQSSAALSLREIIERVGPELGDWPSAVTIELVYAFAGHLERLQRFRQVEIVSTGPPLRYAVPATNFP